MWDSRRTVGPSYTPHPLSRTRNGTSISISPGQRLASQAALAPPTVSQRRTGPTVLRAAGLLGLLDSPSPTSGARPGREQSVRSGGRGPPGTNVPTADQP